MIQAAMAVTEGGQPSRAGEVVGVELFSRFGREAARKGAFSRVGKSCRNGTGFGPVWV